MTYSTKGALTTSLKNGSMCRSCAGHTNNWMLGRTGEANPFYGKKHTEETIHKFKATQSSRDNTSRRTDEFRAKISKVSSGNKNPMYGKTYYEKWVEKYGKEEADIRQAAKIAKHKVSSSGSNNPMYGKPTPKKAGNGWSGWYKEQFFRSLRELSYIVNVLEPSGKEWKSAESIRIPYKNYDGANRTYSPDFICDGKLIEIKPIKLIESPLIKLKSEAAREYCVKNDLVFLITDVSLIDKSHLDQLIANGLVRLTDKTAEKYNGY